MEICLLFLVRDHISKIKIPKYRADYKNWATSSFRVFCEEIKLRKVETSKVELNLLLLGFCPKAFAYRGQSYRCVWFVVELL